MKNKQKAFTLVELLVAMAIIGIILGLAVFGISLAQRGGRDTQRRSALEDLSAGAADLYSKSGGTVASIHMVNDGSAGWVALVRTSSGSTLTTKAACDGSIYCVTVPLKGPTNPGATVTLTNGAGGTANNTSTKFYFNTQTDGYHLAACMENNSVFSVSTSANAMPTSFTCP